METRRRPVLRQRRNPGRPLSPLRLCLVSALAAGLWASSGCVSSNLNAARRHFYLGHFDQAVDLVSEAKPSGKNEMLFYMERGMLYQAQGNYEASAQDLITAADIYQKRKYSVSKGGASMLINDEVQPFLGAPYEQTLLHAFTAKNHMALGHWNDAGVEARRIIRTLEPNERGNYPDAAYARYLSGLCLQLQDDPSNAALQFRKANELLPHLTIDETTGHITPDEMSEATARNQTLWPTYDGSAREMVCFVNLGRSVANAESWNRAVSPGSAAYAEFYADGKYLGRSYPFSDTVDLRFTTQQHQAARKSLKTGTRVVLKEAIAQGVAYESSEELGDLVRYVLLGMLEKPDDRHWETLPRRLQVARFACPPDLTSYEVVFLNAQGHPTGRTTVSEPLNLHRQTYVSFCRDVQGD